jgi:preprotein translocase subunit SecB
MSENTPASAAGEQQFGIHKVYTKDVSFEAPNTPQIFKGKWEPQINVQLTSKTQNIGDDTFEVVLSITVTANLNDKTAYLAEVHQAGIFGVKGFEAQALDAMLGSYCPNILFPFAREVVSDIVTKGGFPQMVLAPVNFDALYAHQLQQRAQQAQGTAAAPVAPKH